MRSLMLRLTKLPHVLKQLSTLHLNLEQNRSWHPCVLHSRFEELWFFYQSKFLFASAYLRAIAQDKLIKMYSFLANKIKFESACAVQNCHNSNVKV